MKINWGDVGYHLFGVMFPIIVIVGFVCFGFFLCGKPAPENVTVFVCPKCGFHFLVKEWYIEMPSTNIFDSARMNDPQAWKEAANE